MQNDHADPQAVWEVRLMATDIPAAKSAAETAARTRGWSRIGLALLVLLGLFYLFGAVNDLRTDLAARLPADHVGTFTAITGTSFAHLHATAPGVAGYLALLEKGYALHELTFGLLFLILVLIPFRYRRPCAWWAAWIPMIANLGYTFTFGWHDSTILTRSLVADIALPILLLAHIPAFFAHPHRQ
jgi:hypothetical protein